MLAQVFAISDYAAGGGAVATTDGSAIEVDAGVRLFANLAVAVVGCLVGAVEVLFLNRRLAAQSLGTKLIAKTLFYVVFLTGVVVVTFPTAAALEMGTGLSDPRVWDRLQAFAISKESLSTGVQLTTSLVASLFYAEISEHMGPRVLTNFLVGRYHTPKEERRVFLFSDMKSSTAITERLGHARYFEFLRAYYAAFAKAIVEHGGEVYQYIGDEIVVSWTEEVGLRDDDCVRCVRRMKRDLRARADWFEDHFGVAPDFRAGLQVGPVTTGEIGALKKEIVFTGDVLNQTARIQALCKPLGVDILVGSELMSRLGLGEGWAFRSVGRQELRGKDQPVELFALEGSVDRASDASGRSGTGQSRRSFPTRSAST
ncbi:adenylate/guanylate cyclase domain-containing protein [Rubrivirga sp.]|uniref:adenylate/guanylate cyclase domain-containing protein n=1 Tax=Rubrivirga sp. TaxID=1885344 RepID=UPI003C76BAFD